MTAFLNRLMTPLMRNDTAGGAAAVATPPLITTARLTLADELIVRGVEPIALDRVRAYQKDVLRTKAQGQFAAWVPESNLSVLSVPRDVRRTVQRVAEIPNTRVYAERFDEDPFVFIARGEGKEQEICCIAFWDAPGFKPR